jgi:GT2 family glycosyltransferase
MKLSIIIVNYNVKFFLEHALLSAQKAAKGISSEIIVVDNHSIDGSVVMLHKKFSNVACIANDKNVGFAKANNQGIKIAKGEYVLLLNPDTVVEEDTFEKCTAFMDVHPEAGALGVKMLDGKGNFLPESKRGFPSPSVAFFKVFGLTKLFPHSKLFARYYLGHLSENETCEAEVLSGAFMFIRKKVLDEIGLLDETFFMYGEDIDLSYRILKAGYKNYYFPETRIIHYKGESTKKGSLNYVRMFYNAMIIFARKHFSGTKAGLLTILLQVAIYFRGALSLLSGILNRIGWPLVDAVSIYVAMYFLENFWQENVKNVAGKSYYPPEYMHIAVPAYIVVWLTTMYFSGAYDKNTRPLKIVRGILVGTIIILAGYGLLSETYRFSRALIILGSASAIFLTLFLRYIFHLIKNKNLRFGDQPNKRAIIVGSEVESGRVMSLITQANAHTTIIGCVFPDKDQSADSLFLGPLSELKDITEVYNADEIIFCAKDISSQNIIAWMTKIGTGSDFKIVPEESLSIIGSNSRDLPGELYTIDINLNIDTPSGRRNKRIFDILYSFMLLVTLPIQLFLVKQFLGLIKNIFLVLLGKKTWVGYAGDNLAEEKNLPPLKQGVLSPLDGLKQKNLKNQTLARLNLLYAKDYTLYKDAEIVIKGHNQLGR